LTVIVARDDGNLARTRRLGLDRFIRLVRSEVTRRGKAKPCLRIVRKVFASVTATAGVVEHRQAALERIGWILTDWERARTDQMAVENRMVAVLGQLQLTDLVSSIDGTVPGRRGRDPGRDRRPVPVHLRPRVVKLAGLAPRERMSGTFTGKTRLSGAGRPRLRVAAWRAVWGCLQNNRVYAARYRHLTSREVNRLKPTQAQTIVAAAILRQLYAVITTGQAWDPAIAAHGVRQANRVGVVAV
jgi:hypothetical protein